MIEIGNRGDIPSCVFDFFIVATILLNLFITIFNTFAESAPYAQILGRLELFTIVVFTAEYALRILTADFLYPGRKFWRAAL